MSQVAAVTAFTLIPEPNTRRPEAKARIVLRGSDAIPSAVPSFQGTVASLPLLEAAAAGNGSINFAPSRDGIIRHVPLVLDPNGELVPGLAAEIVRLLRRKRSVVVNVEGSAISAVRLGSVPVQPDAGGLLWLHYRAGDPAVYIPAWRLLSPDFTEPRLKGAAAIVGTSAKGLQDIRFTPLGELVPGVDVHVQAVEQALADTFLRRPQWAEGLEVLLTLILGIVLAVIGTLMRARLSATGLVVIAGGALVTGFFLFRGERLLVDPAPSVIGGVCAYLVAALWQLAYRERQNRFIRGAFAQYISPNLVGYLIENPESLSLGGERRECSFVLTDLAGFTATVEQSSPVELTAVLNAYLEGMVDIAFRHDGTLDRIVGDAVAVMFAAPVDQPDHRRRALACAVDMDDFAQQFVAKHRPAHPTLTGTRIGVNSGPVVVGNFGGERVFDYRALGDAVNVTARLESANRHLGTRVCVAEESLRVRPETLCRITEFSEHESNGRELDEGERVAVEVLPVLGRPAAAVEPGDGAFDHPTPGLDDEALHPIGSLDDLGLEIGQDAGQGAVKDRPLIGAVGEQFPEKGKQTEQGRQQRETAVAILNVGGGDDAVQQQALRIDQNMPLLALDQLAGIEAVAVDASPPFSALFTL